MMAAVLIMAMTAGVLGGCGNSTGNNAKTDTNAQNNANTAEIKECQCGCDRDRQCRWHGI